MTTERTDAAEQADEAGEELYDLPPEAFTSARDALVKRLRSDGQRDAAARVAKLRRPSVAAWAVNQAVRSSASAVQELHAAAEEVMGVQRRAVSGLSSGEQLRAADGRRRRAVDALLSAAEAALDAAGRDPEPHRRGMRDTFDAASLDPAALADVARGRLSKPLQAPSGFGAVEGLTLAPQRPVDPAPEADRTAAPSAGRNELDAGSVDAASQPARRSERDEAERDAEAAAAQRARAEQEAQEATRRRQLVDAARAAGEEAQAAERAAADADRTARTLEGEARLLERRANSARTDAEAAADRARRMRQTADQAEAAAHTAGGGGRSRS